MNDNNVNGKKLRKLNNMKSDIVFYLIVIHRWTQMPKLKASKYGKSTIIIKEIIHTILNHLNINEIRIVFYFP